MVYTLTINSTDYDISRLVPTGKCNWANAICTTDAKMPTSSASISIEAAAGRPAYASLLSSIITARDAGNEIGLTIYDGTDYVFRGTVDVSTINIVSAKFPDSLSLPIRDKTLIFDKVCTLNQYWENMTVKSIVNTLVSAAGWTGTVVNMLPTTDNYKFSNPCVDASEQKTYREYINSMLGELPGYVLYYAPATDAMVIDTVDKHSSVSDHIVNYLVSSKLKTVSKIWDHDGILVTYPTISSRANTNLYAASIDYAQGEAVASGDYYPEDSDSIETFLNYSEDGLDRDYQSGYTKRANKDIALIYAKNCSYSVVPSGVFTEVTADFYPKRAQIALRNNKSTEQLIRLLSITGDAVYVSKKNQMALPSGSAISNPETIECEYITTEAQATALGQFRYNWNKRSKIVCTWEEPVGIDNQTHLGDVVTVKHKDARTSQKCLVVQVENQALAGNSARKLVFSAVAVDNFETISGTLTAEPTGKSLGKFTTYFAYADDAQGTNFSTTPYEGAKYIGVLSSDALTQPLTAASYSWSKFKGEDGSGDPMLSLRLSAYSYTSNRRSSENNFIEVYVDYQGYEGTPVVTVSDGFTIENGVITIPFTTTLDNIVVSATINNVTKTAVIVKDDTTVTKLYQGYNPLPAAADLANAQYQVGVDGTGLLEGDYTVAVKGTSPDDYRAVFAWTGAEWSEVNPNENNQYAYALLGTIDIVLAGNNTASSPSASWFGTLIGKQGVFEQIFAMAIEVGKSIRGGGYDENGAPTGGPGFYFDKNGKAKLYEAEVLGKFESSGFKTIDAVSGSSVSAIPLNSNNNTLYTSFAQMKQVEFSGRLSNTVYSVSNGLYNNTAFEKEVFKEGSHTGINLGTYTGDFPADVYLPGNLQTPYVSVTDGPIMVPAEERRIKISAIKGKLYGQKESGTGSSTKTINIDIYICDNTFRNNAIKISDLTYFDIPADWTIMQGHGGYWLPIFLYFKCENGYTNYGSWVLQSAPSVTMYSSMDYMPGGWNLLHPYDGTVLLTVPSSGYCDFPVTATRFSRDKTGAATGLTSYYMYNGLTADGAWTQFTGNFSISYTPAGGSAVTYINATSVESSGKNLKRNGVAILSANTLLSAISVSFTPLTKPTGIETMNISPMSPNSYDLGSQDNPFRAMYANNFHGTHIGNVNAAGTPYIVYGAVFN